MSQRGQLHLKTITRARPVSLKPPIQHLLCIGASKGACTRRLFNSLFFGASTTLVGNDEANTHGERIYLGKFGVLLYSLLAKVGQQLDPSVGISCYWEGLRRPSYKDTMFKFFGQGR